MKPKVLVAILIGHLLLIAGAFWFLQSQLGFGSRPPAPAAASAPSARENFEKLRSKPAPVGKRGVTNGAQVVYVTNQFRWNQLESSDYREYIANLRGVGCPEATIKDIIMTDVMRLYAARRGQFYHNGREFKFWETNDKRKLNARQLQEREGQLSSIDKEIPGVLRELLGINYERELNKYFVDSNEDQERLGFLKADQQKRVLALREEMEGKRELILDRAQDGQLSAEDQAALQELEAERKKKLAGFLSQAEIEALELHTSAESEKLREELVGFEPSEEEFRQIYALEQSFAEKYGGADNLDEAGRAEKAATLQQQLGEERYAAYERAQNPAYHQTVLFTQLYELPSKTAVSIFDMKNIAEQGKIELLANPAIPAENKANALAELRRETERSLAELMGSKLASAYLQSSGKWVQTLGGN